MLTLEQIKSLFEQECDYQQEHHGSCEECSIFNLFGRSGQCAYRLYDGQFRPEVAKVIQELQERWEADKNENDPL